MGVRPVGVTLGSLSKYFPQQQIEAILRASGREGTRRRKLPALELMYYLIALGLHAITGDSCALTQTEASRTKHAAVAIVMSPRYNLK